MVSPIALLIAGPLADYVFEPAFQPGGSLASSFGSIFGVGPGSGMAMMIFLFNLLVVISGLSGYLFPAIRNAERILPDHDETPSEPILASSEKEV